MSFATSPGRAVAPGGSLLVTGPMGDEPAQVQYRLGELAGDDRPFVTMPGWKLHRLDRQWCADWSAYLLPKSIRRMGDPEMTLHTRAGADALLQAGAKSLCLRCGDASSLAVGEVSL